MAGRAPLDRSAAPTALRLSAQQARLLHLGAQGLLNPPGARARKPDVLAAIRRMHVLQIDTIHVVARSPYLVLYSRLGAYDAEWLGELLDEGAVFECWAHEACFAPIDDYPLHRRHVIDRGPHWSMRIARHQQRYYGKGMRALLEQVRERGPVKTSDFVRVTGKSGGWWGWKSEKRWLEALFALGELMITRRERFHRVYDLTERVLAKPGALASTRPAPPTETETRRQLIINATQALGVTQARWINDYFRSGRRLKDADLDGLVAEGELQRVEVESWQATGYVHRDQMALATRAAAGRLRATQTVLLSPFDPVVWDRERAATLFDFDYTLECYVPAPKRVYGYYVLPILHRGRLIGRLDAKAHRAEGVFEVRALYLEPGSLPSERLAAAVAGALAKCAAWHATPVVKIGRTAPAALARLLRTALAGRT